MVSREVREGLQYQGPNESIAYRLRVTPAAASAVGVTVRDQETGADVTVAVCSGAPTVSDGALILPALHDLEENHFYEVEAAYLDASGNQVTPLIRVLCS